MQSSIEHIRGKSMSKFIRTHYSLHCLEAHIKGFKPLTIKQFVRLTFKIGA